MLADDHPFVLLGYRSMLATRECVAIVGEARTSAELIALLQSTRCDVLISDLSMLDPAGGTEVKRDLEHGVRDEVRILTVHGAKGLQAPVVFLPDTCNVPAQSDPIVWTPASVPLWPPRRDTEDPVSQAARIAAKARRDVQPRQRKAGLVLAIAAVALSVLAAVVWIALIAAGFSVQDLQDNLQRELERQRRAGG